MSRRARSSVVAVALFAAALCAASAFASGSGTLCTVYCKSGTHVQKQVGKDGPAGTAPFTPPVTAGGTLPFTGLDLGFIALAGVVLVFAGFGLHRLTRKPPEPPTA
jgi:hypothetical protein